MYPGFSTQSSKHTKESQLTEIHGWKYRTNYYELKYRSAQFYRLYPCFEIQKFNKDIFHTVQCEHKSEIQADG